MKVFDHPAGFKLDVSDAVSQWRADTFFTKEPWTVAWLEQIAAGDVLADVGANIGIYSLFAASRGVRVFAFEPESQNYAALNRNIFLNGFENLIAAFPLALAGLDGIANSSLYLSRFGVGGSCHTAGRELDFTGKQMSSAFRQGCIVAPYRVLFPPAHYIKLDVDGNEADVIGGFDLADSSVKSLLVEVNFNRGDHLAMLGHVKSFGFVCDSAQINRALRGDGPFKNCAEVIFKRP